MQGASFSRERGGQKSPSSLLHSYKPDAIMLEYAEQAELCSHKTKLLFSSPVRCAMDIHLDSIVEKTTATLIVALLFAVAASLVGYASGVIDLEELTITLTAVAIFVALAVLYVFISRRGKTLLATLVTGFVGVTGWLYRNRQVILGALLVLVAISVTYVLTRSWSVVVVALIFSLGMVILTRSVGRLPQDTKTDAVFQAVRLPIGKFTNASLTGKYLDFPLGRVDFGGIPFFINENGYIFDTSEARYIEADGTVGGELT